jgi:hypothetical protein
MKNYLVLDYCGGARGVPVWVDGVIEEYVQNPWNDADPDAEMRYRDQTPLNFRTKHRVIDFDFCENHNLIVCSDHFINRLSGYNCHFVTRPLRVWEGQKECLRKKFFVFRIQERIWAMDMKKSEYRVNRDPATGEIRYSLRSPEQKTIRTVYKLIIDQEKTNEVDFFYCEGARKHIVSEELADSLKSLKGVRVTPTADYVFPGSKSGEKIIDRG